MRIVISTEVEQPWEKVYEGFDEKLFLALNPPFPPVKLLQFDGCHKGDVVALELNFLFFRQRWESHITFDETGENHFTFIDKGVKLPFFLSNWKHTHSISASALGSVITDDIQYTTGTLLTDLLFYPVLFGQFLYRKPVYKKIFRRD